jgi:leader peptidase (prepilin peptidase)/N-methyltransferase
MSLDVWTGLPIFLALGAIFGSLNTAFCYRIPREIPLGLFEKTRSECPHCKRVIPLKWNIPLFSYLFLRGRCGWCRGEIPLRYFLIELSTTLLFGLTWVLHSGSSHLPTSEIAAWAELAKVLWFAFSLVAVIFIDVEFRIIPDRFSIGNTAVALAAALLWGNPPILESILGAALGFGAFFLMSWGYEKLRGEEGLGFGDVKMMAWLGAWTGFASVPFIILVASLTGLAAGLLAMRRSSDGFKTAIPFGPFLAAAGYAAWALHTLDLW